MRMGCSPHHESAQGCCTVRKVQQPCCLSGRGRTLVDADELSEIAQGLQAGLDALNAKDPTDFDPPTFLANPRHPCSGHRIAKSTGRPVSTAIDLKERYVVGWEEDGSPVMEVGDAKIAIIYREGKCLKCGYTARSSKGKIVKVAERPPLMGRVARA